MPKVTFIAAGKEYTVEVDAGIKLLTVAFDNQVPIISTCGGQPSCTDCRVKVLEGMENLSPAEFPEQSVMGSVSHITKERLSCQAKVLGDVKVEVLRVRSASKAKPRATSAYQPSSRPEPKSRRPENKERSRSNDRSRSAAKADSKPSGPADRTNRSGQDRTSKPANQSQGGSREKSQGHPKSRPQPHNRSDQARQGPPSRKKRRRR